jgi:integrase
MSVRKRKTSIGQSEEYHYEFMQSGKRYYGVCEGCTTERAALSFEKTVKERVKKLAAQKSARALVENFRDEMTGGEQIKLAEAYELSLEKPRRRQPSVELIKIKSSYWMDFVAFMEVRYPDIITLPNVRHEHAEAYIQYLRKNGRFVKTVSYKRGRSKITTKVTKSLSGKTINTYQQTLSEVFQLLARDAGMLDNPFADIPKLPKNAAGREAFTEKELALIRDNLDDFTKPLFIIAIATALREGDICQLRWSEVDFDANLIVRKMNKTGTIVEIPILPPLKKFLLEQWETTGSEEYVLPFHAQLYGTNRTGVSYRIKKFLENLGIETTRRTSNRSRATSIKDLHSCRHTFCYNAGMYGIPIAVVQSIVGHLSSEMTKHYSAHATREAKRTKMELLPDFMGIDSSIETQSISPEPEREQLKQLAEILPIKTIKKILEHANKVLKND